VFPKRAGRLELDYNLQHVLKARGAVPFDGELTVRLELFADGKAAGSEIVAYAVRGGEVEAPRCAREFVAEGEVPGYLEMHIEADQAVFGKLLSPPGYAILARDGFGAVIVTSDQKYANPRVIEEIRSTGRFCMVHTAALVDRAAGIDNSLLLINPYEQDLTATIRAGAEASLRRKVPRKCATLVSLTDLLPDGEWSTYMVTANNRVLTYDIRHKLDDPLAINSMDHLDVFSGMPTHRDAGPVDIARSALRRALRESGIRYS
jgi:hypothetical protein